MSTREQILVFIGDFTRKHGYAPSYREIAEGCGIKSPSTVLYHLRTLQDEGRVSFVESLPRTVHVTTQAGDKNAKH